MNKTQEALKAALESFVGYRREISLLTGDEDTQPCDAERLCKSALSEIEKCYGEATPVSEPVAFLVDGRIEQGLFFDKASAYIMAEANCGDVNELYTSPISKEWVGLSDSDIVNIGMQNFTDIRFARAIEAKLKQLNTVEKG